MLQTVAKQPTTILDRVEIEALVFTMCFILSISYKRDIQAGGVYYKWWNFQIDKKSFLLVLKSYPQN